MTDLQSNLIIQFDDLLSCADVLWENSLTEEFLKYIMRQEMLLSNYEEIKQESVRLKQSLDKAIQSTSMLDLKLKKARTLLDVEKKQVLRLESERNAMANVLDEIHRILCDDSRCKLPEEMKNRLTVMTSNNGYYVSDSRFSCQADLESSDLSLTYSEFLSESGMLKGKRKFTSVDDEESCTISMPKKRSSIYPTLAPLASQSGSLESAESEHEVAFESETGQFTIFDRIITRIHRFENCVIKKGTECLACGKKIRLKAASKCAVCNSIIHADCESTAPLPCIPMGPPTKSGDLGNLEEYGPSSSPFIETMIAFCIREVEQRGLQEKGIYRVSGDHKEVQELKEKFFKYKTVPNLSKIEINSVCSLLKEFLRSLNDPLIPKSKWTTFAQTISESDKVTKLCEAVSSLPPNNRNTLALLILHLQKVSKNAACYMTVYNLATVFGPTVVGYSDPVDSANLLVQIETSNKIMEELLSLNSHFWSDFLKDPMFPPPTPVSDTPSKEVFRKISRKYFSRR